MAPIFARKLHNAVQRQPTITNNFPHILSAVPLGSRRLAERGFNQALEIAKPFSRMLNVPLQHALTKRQHDTLQQAKLSPQERRKNLRNAFMVPPQASACIRGRHIGIFDDAMTTGETMNELARTLKLFIAARVTNFAFVPTRARSCT